MAIRAKKDLKLALYQRVAARYPADWVESYHGFHDINSYQYMDNSSI